MPTAEISTRAIVLHALQEKKAVFIPYIYRFIASDSKEQKSAMDMVALHSSEDYESLQHDTWGIPTPNKDTIEERNCIWGEKETSQSNVHRSRKEDLDVIIMPGLAFDRNLSRLGHGKGFYDSFLQHYQRSRIADDSANSQNKMPFLSKVLPQDIVMQ